MERFMQIDWNPAIEDIIDDIFIGDERMEKESSMYRLLTGTFTDPFKNIESDYVDVDLQLIKKMGGDVSNLSDEEEQHKSNTEDSAPNQTKKKGKKKAQKTKKEDTVQKQKKDQRSYVPGMRKLPFPFPRHSYLNKSQHAMCLHGLLQLSSNSMKNMSVEKTRQLDDYMALQKIISDEQNEFLEFAKNNWDTTVELPIKCDTYIVQKWKARMQKFQEIPRYYVECKNIAFSSNKNIIVKFISCLQQGFLPKVILPVLDRPCLLRVNDTALLKKYQPHIAPDKLTQHFRLPVSEDTCCESYAEENEVDLVISSSGLKCLMNNIGSDYSNSWIIPVTIKSHNGKNVLYIDKKLPPIAATVPQKNVWVYKYILRYLLIDNENKLSKGATCPNEHKYNKDEFHSDSDNESPQSPIDHLKIYEEDLCNTAEERSDLTIDNESHLKTNKLRNVTYNLFTIEPGSYEQNELTKKYRILVRTKTSAVEVLPNGETQFLTLSAKLEHQLGYGAEAATLDEGLQEWVSLIFRPGTALARVRISADTSEVIQIEKHTGVSLSNEMKRLYNVKVEDSLNVLYNVIEGLSSLTPGHYIMRHTIQNGPFVILYKQAEEHGKNVFDLHTICRSEIFRTLPITPWPPIDKMVTTPSLKYFQRMPAMFIPSGNNIQISLGLKAREKRNFNKQDPPRRSLREKKPNRN